MYEEMQEPDTEIRPPQHPMCHLPSCKHLLEQFSTRKHIRTYANEAAELGIYYNDWGWLCYLCKLSVHHWFCNVVWDDAPHMTRDFRILELQIARENAGYVHSESERRYYSGWASEDEMNELNQECYECSIRIERITEEIAILEAELAQEDCYL
jgi:hypothetical protein